MKCKVAEALREWDYHKVAQNPEEACQSLHVAANIIEDLICRLAVFSDVTEKSAATADSGD